MKKLLFPLSLLLICILAFAGTASPRPDAQKDLIFDALYALHTESHDPSEYTAYDWDGTVIEDFYIVTADMDVPQLQAYCREHIQKLARLEVKDETSPRNEPMKTGYLTCTEAFRTPNDNQYCAIRYTVEASAIYAADGSSFAYTYTPQIGSITYTLPEGWSYSHLGHDMKDSIRSVDGHAYFFYQFNSKGTWLGRSYDLGQSLHSFTIAP